jgi:DNA recombination protein RmuC
VGGGSSLRPDAVIFLPQDMVMVIDSKASKFLLEIAEAEEKGVVADELLKGFAQTMNKHLNDLRTKDYEAAIRAAFEGSGRSGAISATHIIMCVPSEAAITHLKQADGQLLQKAEKLGIIVASPASLFGLLSLARHNLGLVRQSENHDRIITNVRQLMDNIIVMLSHAEKVGKGLENASKHYGSFSASINRNVLSKMRQLTGFGIVPAKSKALPDRLSTFEVRSGEEPLTIEGEVETVDDTNAIEDFSKQKISA